MGSRKKVTVGYRYYLGLHFGLCHGPVDMVKKVVVGERDAWVGNQATSGSVAINQPELFGGDKREGGVVGQLDILMGEPAQIENTYLQAKIGTLIPAFRGILSAVWRGGQVTSNNPYLKPWAFLVQRILQGWSGGSAWYPQKAIIPGESCGGGGGGVFVSQLDMHANDASPDGSSYALEFAADPDEIITIEWLDATYKCWAYTPFDGYNAHVGDWSYRLGVLADGVFTEYNTTGYETEAEAKSAEAWAAVQPVQLTGASVYRLFLHDATVDDNRGGLSLRIMSSFFRKDMNPAHIIYQCLTDTAWGMGYQTASIDNTSFTAAADTLYAESFGLSMVWNQQETIEAFISIILDHIGGMLYVRPDTGAFALKLIRDDYDRETLPIYGPANLISAENYQRQAWGETVNEITVVYTNGCTGKDEPATVHDLANIQIQGGVVAQTRNYPGIRKASLAQRVALRDLNAGSTPLASVKLTATRAAWQVFPGDVLRLTWPEYQIDDVVYRVLNVNRGTLTEGQIIIDAVEDVFGLPDNTYLVEQPGGWVDPSNEPAAAPYRKLLEVPYWDLVRTLSAAEMAYVDSLSGYLETVAVRPSGDATNYSLYAKVGAADYIEGGNGDFCPSATVVSALTKTTTAITLANGVDLDLVAVGGYAVVDDEYVLVTAINALALTATISRGVLDTVPAEHSAGARIWFADSYTGFTTTEYADGETVDVKLLPLTGQGELDISLAPVDSLTMDQRQYRPYAPGKVLVNTQQYPEWIDGFDPLTVAWAHRDRLAQTAYLVEQSEASIGPEAGVTYNLRIYGEADGLIKTYSSLSGTSQTYPLEEEGSGGDALFASVVLGLHMDGADNGTTFSDLAGNTVTAHGNAVTKTAIKKFGTASAYFDGAGDYLSLAYSAALEFLTSDFTVECWVYLANSATYQMIVGGSANGDFMMALNYPASAISIGRHNVAWDSSFSTHGIATNTWAHIEISRASGTCRCFVNGTSIGTPVSNSLSYTNTGLQIGANSGATVFNGYIDDLRITNGAGRHTSNFTAPTAAFPDSAATINGRLRFELESVRGGLISYQKHNHTVLREGYGFNYGYYYGGQ